MGSYIAIIIGFSPEKYFLFYNSFKTRTKMFCLSIFCVYVYQKMNKHGTKFATIMRHTLNRK